MTRREAQFGKTMDGGRAKLFTLTNANGMSMSVTDYGAALTGLLVPDKAGRLADVVLGFEDVSGYEKTRYYMGATIGRHAGQICEGEFELGGAVYRLTVNDHSHTMHGGPGGFHKRLFCGGFENDGSIALSYYSEDGEAGFPGGLRVTVIYRLTEENELLIDFYGSGDRDTILSMTNHAYFNLNGQGGVMGHRLKINAEQYTEVDAQGLPTGKISPVVGTPFDFLEARPLAEFVDAPHPQLAFCAGYDHNWVLREECENGLRLCCELESESGRTMRLLSNQPGLQVYSGNYLDGLEKGKGGVFYAWREAVCLEPQRFPNGLNHPHFPSPVLKKGEQYHYRSVYRFFA